MALYNIPVENLSELTKRIKRIQNKGADITFNIGKEVVEEHELNSGAKIAVKCYEVEVEGQYKINDWSFVGTIEHSGAGNIIRSINSSLEGKIPAKYRTVGQECEHCHQIRDRKDTFLIHNDKTDEFKQVGRTCLRGYTGGLDAERCAQFVDVFNYLFELEHPKEFGDFSFSGFVDGSVSLSTESIKKTVFGYVKSYGYTPKVSGLELAEFLFSQSGKKQISVTDATAEEVAEMNAWVETVNTNSDYMWNAKTAWTKSSTDYRDVALLASFVQVYLKSKSEEAKRVKSNSEKTNEYVGNVGDRITIKDIKSIRVLYTKDGSQFGYRVPDTYVYEIIDASGYTYIWSTTHSSLEEYIEDIQSINATIKAHQEYKGLKQTVITRGKINYKETKKPEATDESKLSENKSMKAIFDFLSSLDD